VLANRADSATIELPFLSVGELRAGTEPVSGISASPTGGGSVAPAVIASGRAVLGATGGRMHCAFSYDALDSTVVDGALFLQPVKHR